MPFPRRCFVAALVVGATLASQDASARQRPPGATSIPITSVTRGTAPGYDATAPLCQLGEHLPGIKTEPVVDFDQLGDYYYTWLNLNPDSCATCGIGTYGQVTAAHTALYFHGAPDTVIVSTRIVSLVQTTCRYQDADVEICPGLDATLIGPNPEEAKDFPIPFPSDCRIEISALGNGQAFLELNFKYSTYTNRPDVDPPPWRPELVVEGGAYRCHTFNPVVFPQQDWTDLYPGSGNPVMYVDVEQCWHVSTVKRTWGQLKTRYRY